MKLADIPALRDAPLASKLALVEEIWADIVSKSDSIPLPEWHVREIDQSLADYQANPREGRPWSEVRDNILRKK